MRGRAPDVHAEAWATHMRRRVFYHISRRIDCQMPGILSSQLPVWASVGWERGQVAWDVETSAPAIGYPASYHNGALFRSGMGAPR